MTAKLPTFALPWDYIINLIFKEYGSKSFYKKFKDGWYKFSKEITKEWGDVYMNWSWVCSQHDFFTKIDSWKNKFKRNFPNDTIGYEIIVAHILPVCAPLFFEQV